MVSFPPTKQKYDKWMKSWVHHEEGTAMLTKTQNTVSRPNLVQNYEFHQNAHATHPTVNQLVMI
jgi:hypothetical protein